MEYLQRLIIVSTKSNLQMEIDTASESLSSSVESRPVLSFVSLSSAALSIADALVDRERRKNIIISLKYLTIKVIKNYLQTSAALLNIINGKAGS